MKKDYYILLIIFFAALFIRTAYTVFFVGISSVPDYDSVQYNSYAVSVAGEGVYRDGNDRSFRSPLYPLFVAGVYYIFGHSYPAVKIVQIILGALTCVLIYFLGLEYGSRNVALYSGLFSCVYFGLFAQPAHILTETLFTFLLILSILCFMKMDQSAAYKYMGPVFAGLTALTRPTTLIFPAFIALWFIIKYPFKKALKETVISALLFFLVIVPWTARNYSIHHKLVFISTDGGIAFGGVHNSDAKGQWSLKYIDISKYSGLNEVERDKKLFDMGIEYLKGLTPIQLVKLELLKISAFIYPFLPKYDFTYGIIFPFWIYGMFLMYKKKEAKNYLLFFVIALFFTSVVIICGSPRYRGPMSPYIIIFGAAGVENIYQKFKNNINGAVIFACWLLFNALLYFYYEPVRTVLKKIRDI